MVADKSSAFITRRGRLTTAKSMSTREYSERRGCGSVVFSMQITRTSKRGAVLRALSLVLVTTVSTLLAVACSGADSNGSASGCAIGGSKCAYGCTVGLGCTECVSNGDCKGSDKPACVLGACRECGVQADCGAAEACFPDDFKCHARCAADGDCPGDAPICLTDTGACVGCNGDADCAASKGEPICAGARAQCSECASSADCGAVDPVCDLNDGKCHECLVDSDCAAPRACGVDRKCHFACSSNADCREPQASLCDVTSRDCVACLTNKDCTAGAPVCGEGKCVECAASADCQDPALPICKGEQCVACGEDRDCGDPALPICKDQECVQCAKDKDCSDAALPKCSGERCVAP